jgi:transcriptional regulator with PAS, ATPase and Fis domain
MGDLVGNTWFGVLDHLDEAVIVLDADRVIRHVNDAARRLLGYEQGHEIGGRCRLTTRGVDCVNACPLTFALEAGLDRVEDFATVYQTVDGRALPLRVTVIPLVNEESGFHGAVEILRPTDPRPGFYLSGSSIAALELRAKAAAVARSGSDVLLVGEPPVCHDVARALHRFSEMPESLFNPWGGSWEAITPWPPGTAYAWGETAESLVRSDRPEGWRLMLGRREVDVDIGEFEIFTLPPVEDRGEDLERMIVTWVEELAPRSKVTPAALGKLARLARDRGFEHLEGVLKTAIAVAGDCIEEDHLPVDGYRTAFMDELLQAPNPLAALEECVLREVLERCGWRMQEAAERVGISRVTLWRKMKDLGIDRP